MTQESSSSVRIAQDVRFIIVAYRGAIGFQFFLYRLHTVGMLLTSHDPGLCLFGSIR